jgi:CheY-like chemotaxis protein
MSKSTILIVDDEKAIHIVLKAMLAKEYNLEFASDAQQAIDILTEKPVNLILLDIQMPELSGLELLQSLRIDTSLKNTPIIIFTGKVTEERQQRAAELGAVGFAGKDSLMTEDGKNSLFKMIKENILREASPLLSKTNYKAISNLIIKSLMKDSKKQDFFFAARRLGLNVMKYFDIDYLSIWAIQNTKTNMLLSLGDKQPEDFGPDEIKSEQAFKEIYKNRSAYLTNNPVSEKKGMFANVAIESGLSSEIGIPLFKISRQALVKSRMNIPKTTPLYGFIILKRNKVFTSKEYEVLKTLIGYSGSILWALFRKLFSN